MRRGVSALAVGLVLCAAAGAAAAATPRTDQPVEADHVRLEGRVSETAARRLERHRAEQCAAMGKPYVAVPADEPVVRITRDVYYANGAITTYTTTRGYFTEINPEECKAGTPERVVISMSTALGVCDIKPAQKRASGHCSVAPLLAGRPKLAVLPARPVVRTDTVAGTPCAVVVERHGAIASERCVASGAPLPERFHRGRPGMELRLLDRDAADPQVEHLDLKAVAVKLRTPVSLQTLAPHLAGGYKVADLSAQDDEEDREDREDRDKADEPPPRAKRAPGAGGAAK